MKRALSFAGIIILFSVTARAQHDLGIATGNWSGTNSLYLNPANIADSRQSFVLDLFSINMGIDNNIGTLSSKGGLIGAITNGADPGNLFTVSSNKQLSMMAPSAEIRGPGLMISINHKHSFALTTRIRGISQFNNFSSSLFNNISNPTTANNENLNLNSQKFNYTAHIWSEIGLTYGVVLFETEKGQLKAGVTLRYLGGIGYIGLKGNNLDVRYKSGNDSLFVSNSDVEYASNLLGTHSAINGGFANNNLFKDFFGGETGAGIGGDIGLSYECMPNPFNTKSSPDEKVNYAKSRYKLRLSVAVTDIGAITYGSNNNSVVNVKGNGYVTGTDLSKNVNNITDFKNYINNQGFYADTGSTATKVHMPTALISAIDYEIYKHLYVNATYLANLANRQLFGNSFYNQLTITPRYDSRMFSFGVPITYSALANDIKVGAGLRFNGFFVGSDDILALYKPGQYGFNFYFGGFIRVNKHKSKERYKEQHKEETADPS